MKNYFNFTLFTICLFHMPLACMSKNDGSSTSKNTKSEMSAMDSMPVDHNTMAKVLEPFFKTFKGKINNREIVLNLMKNEANYLELYSGYYYFADEQIPRLISGRESLHEKEALVDFISNINWEKEAKKKPFLYTQTELIDYQFKDIGGLNMGFRGWFREHSFQGLLSHPTLTTKTTFNLTDGFDRDKTIDVLLNEVLEEQSFSFSKKFILKILDDSKADKNSGNEKTYNRVIQADITLPTYKQDAIKNQFIQSEINKLFFKNPNNNKTIGELFEQALKDNNLKSTAKHNYRLLVPYFDKDILSLSLFYNIEDDGKTKQTLTCASYDLKTLKKFQFSDIFISNSEKDIWKKISEKDEFKAYVEEFGLETTVEKIDLNNFLITQKGITFIATKIFPASKIANIHFFLPFSDIKNLLNKDIIVNFKN